MERARQHAVTNHEASPRDWTRAIRSKEAAQPVDDGTHPRDTPVRVLVIDDDPCILTMLDFTFRFEEIDGHYASSGELGMAMAAELRPDVIVLDIMMPDLDGYEVARRLAQQPETADIPIVFCTALADDHSTWKGWQTGAASYVAKPFDIAGFVAELNRVSEPVPAPAL